MVTSEDREDLFFNFFRPKRETAYHVEADSGDKIFCTKEFDQLSVVDLRDKDILEPVKYLAEIAGERIDVAQMSI
jgi:hypothetical protein